MHAHPMSPASHAPAVWVNVRWRVAWWRTLRPLASWDRRALPHPSYLAVTPHATSLSPPPTAKPCCLLKRLLPSATDTLTATGTSRLQCGRLSRRGSGKWNGYGTHRKQQRHQQREATIKVVPMSGPSHTPQCLPAMASQPRVWCGVLSSIASRATRTIAPHPPQDDGGRDP